MQHADRLWVLHRESLDAAEDLCIVLPSGLQIESVKLIIEF
jgi:hypothetical protein